MSVTFKPEIKKVPTSKGTFPVYIRITKDRKLKRVKTTIELNHYSDWNPNPKNGRYIRTSERNASFLNDQLDKEIQNAKEIYRDDMNLSIDAISDKMKGIGRSVSFADYARLYAERLAVKGATNASHYMGLYNKLCGFMAQSGRLDIEFNDLTPVFLSDFERYLYGLHNMQFKSRKVSDNRLNPNTIKCILVRLRAVVNKAINEDLMSMEKNPFHKFTMPKEVAVNRCALDEDELQKFIELDVPSGGRLWDAKNCYLFSFYCAGIRIGDLFKLKWLNIVDDGKRIQYVMTKTQKVRNYPLQPQAKAILDLYRRPTSKPNDYIFPFLNNDAPYSRYSDTHTMPAELKVMLNKDISSKTCIMNHKLQELAKMAGINKHITNHTSRHSFASIAKGKDISSKMLQEAMGHSSLTITERYMHDFGNSEMDKALNKVFDGNSEDRHSSFGKVLNDLRAMSKEDRMALIELLNAEGNE